MDDGAGVRVRPARPADAERLLEVSLASIAQSTTGHYDPAQRRAWAALRTADRHRTMIARDTTLVAEVDGVVAGFTTVALHDRGPLELGEVDQLFVAPEHGGRGVARALLEAVAAAAAAAGVPSLVTHASWRAVPVFERLGYRCEQTETVQAGDQQLRRARMRRGSAP